MPEPAEADQLYQVAPEQFTAARDALVKTLRAAGRRDEAALVAKRRRPPATAWALNRLARTRPELIGGVLETGDHLRRAMEDAVGGDAAGLRAAQDAERRAAAAAVDAAAGILEQAGHRAGDDVRQRLGATLLAAVIDEDLASRLTGGVLDADHDVPGFGFGGGLPAPVRAAPAERPDPALRERERQERLERHRLEEEADRLTKRAERLRAEAEEAAAVAARAEQAATGAERDASAARQALEAKRSKS